MRILIHIPVECVSQFHVRKIYSFIIIMHMLKSIFVNATKAAQQRLGLDNDDFRKYACISTNHRLCMLCELCVRCGGIRKRDAII